DVVAEIGRAEAEAIVGDRLLEAGIPALAFFRLEVGIGNERKRRKIHIELAQRRRLETRPIGCLELGVGPGNDEYRRHTPGFVVAERLVVVVAEVRYQEKPLGEFRLQL